MFCTALLEYTFPCAQIGKKGTKTLLMEKRCRKLALLFLCLDCNQTSQTHLHTNAWLPSHKHCIVC